MDSIEKRRVKIGVAGAGSMGSCHIRILSEQSGVFDLVGIFDPDPAKKEIADRYNTKFFGSYEEMLSEVEAVVIASPSSMHYEMSLIAADHGVHALMEKPIAETVEQAEEMLRVFREKNLLISVSYVERYSPVIRALQDVLEDEDIVAIEVHRCSPYDPRIFDVDVISDLMIHDVDLVVDAIMDSMPCEIDAVGRKAFTDKFADYAQSTMRFENGVLGFITSSRSTQDKIRMLCVHTREAYIEADMLNKTLTVKRRVQYDEGKNMHYRQSSLIESIVVPNKEPLKEDLLNFGRAVLGKEALIITHEHIIRSMKVLDKVHQVVYSKGI